jgi:PST family polysaccharide transporter
MNVPQPQLDTPPPRPSAGPGGLDTGGPRAFFSSMFREGLLQNMLALWGVQFFRKTLPLITLPYLARVLGPSGWGLVAFFQGFAACLVILTEFGFLLSGTREVARCRDSREQRAELFAGVLGAQVLLAGTGIGIALIVRTWIPALHNHPAFLFAGLLYGAAEGLNPSWYFLGMERMGVVATLEITCKCIATAAIFLLVTSPDHGWRVLALQAIAPVLSLIAAMFLAYRTIPFRWPTVRLVRQALQTGWAMFLFRSGESLYTMANAFLLGLFAPPAIVGYFAGAEKISRAFFGLLNPVRETLYPRVSNLVQRSPAEAGRLARIGMAFTLAAGGLLGIIVYTTAPLLIRILMGKDFAPAVDVLRLLAVLPPILSLTHSLGLQWLLPLGRERTVNRIMISAGILNVVLALILCPRYGHMGMATAVVISESYVCACMVVTMALDPSRRHLLARGNPGAAAKTTK